MRSITMMICCGCLLFLALLMFLVPQSSLNTSDNLQVKSLEDLHVSFTSLSQLKGRKSNGGHPCLQSLSGVSCSGSTMAHMYVSNKTLFLIASATLVAICLAFVLCLLMGGKGSGRRKRPQDGKEEKGKGKEGNKKQTRPKKGKGVRQFFDDEAAGPKGKRPRREDPGDDAKGGGAGAGVGAVDSEAVK